MVLALLENDVIFAYLNRYDPYHQIAKKIFYAIRDGAIKVAISSISLIEMELIYKSEGREADLPQHLAALASLPNVSYLSLLPDTALTSVYLREETGLSFFGSHYATTALKFDRRIVSFDQDYDGIEGLERVLPDQALAKLGQHNL